MDGILEICMVIGGLLIILGVGGAACNLVCRLPILERMLSCWFKSLPMGRDKGVYSKGPYPFSFSRDKE